MWRRFWFRSRKAAAEYAPEVLHAGWVPQLPVDAVATAAAMTAAVVTAAVPATQVAAPRPGADEPPVRLGAAMAGIAAPATAPVDSETRDLLARFYANQGC